MTLKVTVKLGSRIFQPGQLQQALQPVVSRNALAVEREAKLRILQGSKTGRTYRRRSIKLAVGAKRATEFKAMGLRRSRTSRASSFVVGYRLHRASAPGESPASDTGALALKIGATETVTDGDSVRASVISGAAYARALEEGATGAGKSKHGSIAARPYLRPALVQVKPQFIADCEAAVKSLL